MNEPVALTQGDILGILQEANSVPLGQPIFNSSEEYNKLKAIIESAIRYTYPVKEMSETRIKQIFVEQTGFYFDDNPADDLALMDFAKALLLEAQEK